MQRRHVEDAAGIHRFATRYENWYAIEEGARLTVLDAGLSGSWSAFCAELAQLGFRPRTSTRS